MAFLDVLNFDSLPLHKWCILTFFASSSYTTDFRLTCRQITTFIAARRQHSYHRWQHLISFLYNSSLVTSRPIPFQSFRPGLLLLTDTNVLYTFELTVGFETNLQKAAIYSSLINDLSFSRVEKSSLLILP